MIRINKSDADLNVLALRHLSMLRSDPFNIESILNDYIAGHTGDVRALFKYFSDNLSKIICSRPYELFQLSSDIEMLTNVAQNDINTNSLNPVDDIKKFNAAIKKVFNYNKFIGSKKAAFAYSHANNLDSPVCLYCNRQYTFTLNKNNKKTRPQFDHFFDKATYPYFALSFFNLVPCCSICNSSFKGTIKFTLSDNVHPLIEGAEKIFRFTIGINAIDYLRGNNFFVEIKHYDHTVSDNDYKKIKGNLRTFAIIDLYNMHKDYIGDILRKAYV